MLGGKIDSQTSAIGQQTTAVVELKGEIRKQTQELTMTLGTQTAALLEAKALEMAAILGQAADRAAQDLESKARELAAKGGSCKYPVSGNAH